MDTLGPTGPLGAAVSELCEQCDIVVSAPCAAFLAGEHSVVPGGPALVTVLPRRVFVGVRGKQRRGNNDSAPRILRLRAFDRRSNSLELPEMDLLTEHEQLRNLASSFKTLYPKKLAEYVPTVIDVVCDGYPARGCNFSGAFAATLALATLAVNGEIQGVIPWRGLPLKEQIRHKEFQKAFKLAMVVETISHAHPSGYGPAFGLLDFDDQPVLYFPHVPESHLFFKGEPRKIKDFAVVPAIDLAISSEVLHQVLGLLIIDTGVPKATKTTITQVRTDANNVADSWASKLAQALWTRDLHSKKARASTDESFIDGGHTPYRLLAAGSVQVIDLLSRISADPRFGVERLLAQIRSISEIHIGLGLDWQEYRDIRYMLRDEIVCGKVAIKLTGGGGGGCIVVLGARKDIESVASRLKDQFTVVFSSLSEDFEHLGPVFVKNADPRQIRIEAADDVVAHVSTFAGSERSYRTFGPGSESRIVQNALQFLYQQGNITHAFFLALQRKSQFYRYRLVDHSYELVSFDSKEVPSRPLFGAMLAAVACNGCLGLIAGEVVVSLDDIVERYLCIKERDMDNDDFRDRLGKTGQPRFNRFLSEICTVVKESNAYSFRFQQPVSICIIEPT